MMRDDLGALLGRRVLTPGGVGRVVEIQAPDRAGMGHWYLAVALRHNWCYLPADDPGSIRIVDEPKQQLSLLEGIA